MTIAQEAKSIILGSYILYLIDSLLDKNERSNATTIRLKQLLFSKTHKAQNAKYVKLSNKAWSMVIEQFKDKHMRLVIFDMVERLAFDNEKVMTDMFGVNLIPYVGQFSLKQTRDGVDNAILKESRIVSDALKKACEKVIFDNKDNL